MYVLMPSNFLNALSSFAVYHIPAVNLKIVFIPLLAFEIIILIDNFRYFLWIINSSQ